MAVSRKQISQNGCLFKMATRGRPKTETHLAGEFGQPTTDALLILLVAAHFI